MSLALPAPGSRPRTAAARGTAVAVLAAVWIGAAAASSGARTDDPRATGEHVGRTEPAAAGAASSAGSSAPPRDPQPDPAPHRASAAPSSGSSPYGDAVARRRLHDAAARLDLRAVLHGPRPIVNIGGRLFRPGDTIEVGDIRFTIGPTRPGAVTVIAEDLSRGMTVTTGRAVPIILHVSSGRNLEASGVSMGSEPE